MDTERSLLRGLSYILAVAFITVAAWVFLGPGHVWIQEGLNKVSTTVNSTADWYQKTFDGPARLVAPLITILSGVYAIYKAWSFAESSLQFRLKEFLDREEKRLSGARPQLRRAVETPGSKRPFDPPFFVAAPLAGAMRELGWGSYFMAPQMQYVDSQLSSALSLLQSQVEYSKRRQTHLNSQLATSHLLKGAMLVTQSAGATDAKLQRAKLLEALHHFKAALALDSRDLEALEYAAEVHVRLSQFEEADIYLNKLLKLTAKEQKSLSRARAFRGKARIWFNGEPQRPMLARDALKDAIRVLPDLVGSEQIEEADLHHALGDAHSVLAARIQALAHLRIAEAIYGLLPTEEASDALGEVKRKISSLLAPQADDDDGVQPTVWANLERNSNSPN